MDFNLSDFIKSKLEEGKSPDEIAATLTNTFNKTQEEFNRAKKTEEEARRKKEEEEKLERTKYFDLTLYENLLHDLEECEYSPAAAASLATLYIHKMHPNITVPQAKQIHQILKEFYEESFEMVYRMVVEPDKTFTDFVRDALHPFSLTL